MLKLKRPLNEETQTQDKREEKRTGENGDGCRELGKQRQAQAAAAAKVQGREKLQMPTQNSQAATPALGITGACPSVCLRAPES